MTTGTSNSGIPPFHPGVDGGAGTRAVRWFLAAKPVRKVVTKLSKSVLDPWLHRITRGRFGARLAMPFASMTTIGARSGEERTTAVLYFNDGPDVILIASNFGGDHNPAWYYNLKAHPTARLARGEYSGVYLAAEIDDEAERERLFALVDTLYRGFADYRERTARIGRRIPMLRLRQAE